MAKIRTASAASVLSVLQKFETEIKFAWTLRVNQVDPAGASKTSAAAIEFANMFSARVRAFAAVKLLRIQRGTSEPMSYIAEQ